MTILYICEKPSQARDIARVLGVTTRGEGYIEGQGIQVTWCLGHLLELAPPESYCNNLKPWRMDVLPVVPKKWVVSPVARTKKQFNIIKKLLKSTKHVIIATDADREGDVIGREILDYCGFKGKVERLWLSALDDVSIKKALGNIHPGSFSENLYKAGLGRQRADWLVGMNLTMAATSLFGNKNGERGQGVLSVGRVQTPTLKLVVDRDREIDNFQPKDYFVLLAEFAGAILNTNSSNTDGNAFWAKWRAPDEFCDEEGRCLHKEYVDAVAQKIENKEAKVRTFSQKQKKTKAPLCFSLSELQRVASSKFGLSAKKTLEVAQSLYEKHKATTYPRTDCGYLPISQFDESKIILNAIKAIDPSLVGIIVKVNPGYRSTVWNDKKITAHHAIIPTSNKNVSYASMSENEKQIYDLIRKRYIAQFLGAYVYMQRKIEVICEEELFKATANTSVEAGWKRAVQPEQGDDDSTNEDDQIGRNIPELKEDEVLSCINNKTDLRQTKPPSRFTEGSLITAMKSIGKYVSDNDLKKVLKDTAGIGTEATRANILETLFKRNYVVKKGKQLLSTDKGRRLVDFLPDILKNPATTAQWEQTLNNIASGKSSLDEFIYDQIDVLDSVLERLSEKQSA